MSRIYSLGRSSELNLFNLSISLKDEYEMKIICIQCEIDSIFHSVKARYNTLAKALKIESMKQKRIILKLYNLSKSMLFNNLKINTSVNTKDILYLATN